MIVSNSTNKVISLHKMLLLLIALCITVYCSFIGLNNLISDSILSRLLQGCLFVLIGFSGGLFIAAYGLNILRNKQVPPPNVWAVEKSKITSGSKAVLIGKFLIFVGLFKLFASSCILYFVINMYLLST
ncbi:hypothetical protein [Pseudoalteromonas sp. SWYJZ19]|uniref:hypothetical protein n=1 Tax=Pseudoalteromonas sp. SWYJZ19 TaxID=2792068 RepID=UPI0018CE0619|nr:hypothetical protein [Pseudoalteromonas sp. SWYJZ19]MBH0051284.1 hypothetical protein [Pseudoalteromonas sp. SWYJZ19]